jgi:hypothetical protein
MTRGQTVLTAVILIAAGILMLVAQYGLPFYIEFSWPMILLVIGGAMIAAFYLTKPKKGYLLNGCIVLWLGFYFLTMESRLGFYFGYDRLWPGLLLAVGLGQLTAAALSRELRLYMIGAVIVAGGGAVLLYFTITGCGELSYSNVALLVAIALILLGVKLVLDFFVEGKVRA